MDIPEGMLACPQCKNGVTDEGDACYHCGNTGLITDEMAFQDKMRGVAAHIATQAFYNLKKAVEENPDGEGWAFRAAENMLTEYEYDTSVVWDYENRAMELFKKMYAEDRTLLEIIIDKLGSTKLS